MTSSQVMNNNSNIDRNSTWGRLRALVQGHLGVAVQEPIEAWNCVRQQAHDYTKSVAGQPIMLLGISTCKTTLTPLRVIGQALEYVLELQLEHVAMERDEARPDPAALESLQAGVRETQSLQSIVLSTQHQLSFALAMTLNPILSCVSNTLVEINRAPEISDRPSCGYTLMNGVPSALVDCGTWEEALAPAHLKVTPEMDAQTTTLLLASALYASMDAAWNRICVQTITPDEEIPELIDACHRVASHAQMNADVSLAVSTLWLVDMAKALPTAASMLNQVQDLKLTLAGANLDTFVLIHVLLDREAISTALLVADQGPLGGNLSCVETANQASTCVSVLLANGLWERAVWTVRTIVEIQRANGAGVEHVGQWREGLFQMIFRWFLEQESSADMLKMVLTPPEQRVLDSFLQSHVDKNDEGRENEKARMLLAGMCLLDNRISSHAVVRESPFFSNVAETVLPVGLNDRTPFVGALLPIRKEMSTADSVDVDMRVKARFGARKTRKSNGYIGAKGSMIVAMDNDTAAVDGEKFAQSETTTNTNVKSLKISRGRSYAAQ